MTGLLERAQAYFIEPAPRRAILTRPATIGASVAVIGLRSGSGATTVARGLECAVANPVLELERAQDGFDADAVVLVAPADSEPALAAIAADLLRARLRSMLLVANRVRDPQPWSRHADVCLPDSRLAAMLVRRGYLPPGELGTALRLLATTLGTEMVSR